MRNLLDFDAAFGNPDVYLEKFVVKPRHIEIQVLGDGSAVMMHDSTVDRTTNGTGNVSEYDAASWQTLTVDDTSSGTWPTMRLRLSNLTIRFSPISVTYQYEPSGSTATWCGFAVGEKPIC